MSVLLDVKRPELKLIQDEDKVWRLEVDGTTLSYVDTEDPTNLKCAYLEQMAAVIDSFMPPKEAIRVVHIGGGAMSLARYVAHTRPGSSQWVFDPDVSMTSFVMKHLPLPANSGIMLRSMDGRTGMETLVDDYADLVIIDAFTGFDIPADLTSRDSWKEVRRVLDGGLAMINIIDRGPLRITSKIMSQFGFPFRLLLGQDSTLKGRRLGNIVLLGSENIFEVDIVDDYRAIVIS